MKKSMIVIVALVFILSLIFLDSPVAAKNTQFDEALPLVTTLDADNITSSSANLNGSLDSLGDYSSVVAVGDNRHEQCKVNTWSDIQQVSAGGYHTVGLKADGTVVAVGLNNYGQCEVSNWSSIQQVSAGYYHTVGLKSDGTVVAVGMNIHGLCEVSSWSDIQQVSAGEIHTIGLRSDGTVVAVGNNDCGQCNISGWSDIQQVSTGNLHTIGLKTDGTVVAVGWNKYGQCEVSSWSDIQQVSARTTHTVGLKYSKVDVSFEWGLDTSYGNETPPQLMTTTGSFKADISGLDSDTTYHFRAKAVANGTVVYGDDVTFTTLPSPPTAPQLWYLDSETTPPGYEMKKSHGSGDDCQTGSVSIGPGNSAIWLADQAALCDVTFPGGSWRAEIRTDSDWGTGGDKCAVTVGGWDTDTGWYEIPTMTATTITWDCDFNILTVLLQTASGTIYQDDYLALNITNEDSCSHKVYTEGRSSLRSPDTDPGYPVPELATGILLGLGLVSLLGYLGLRRYRCQPGR